MLLTPHALGTIRLDRETGNRDGVYQCFGSWTAPLRASAPWVIGRGRESCFLCPMAPAGWRYQSKRASWLIPGSCKHVSNLRSNNGQVGCTLYNSGKGFPTDSTGALQRRWCPIANSASACVFDPIPAGIYAVACFHDENKNGKCDTGLFGIPTEGTVVSNHAKGFMGPPSFDKAKFSFSGIASELQLRMGY